MENAVLRGTRQDPLQLGTHCLVGPRAYLVGATIADEVFLATGTTVFNGARVESRSEVRINATVHLRSRLPTGATVPIGWVAVGDPAHILPPDQHEQIWAVQQRLDFPGYVFGLDRDASMTDLTHRYGHALDRHRDDRTLSD